MSDKRAHAVKCLKDAIRSYHNGQCKIETHNLALKAIRALKKLPLDSCNGNGYTWREDLQSAIDIAFDTQTHS